MEKLTLIVIFVMCGATLYGLFHFIDKYQQNGFSSAKGAAWDSIGHLAISAIVFVGAFTVHLQTKKFLNEIHTRSKEIRGF